MTDEKERNVFRNIVQLTRNRVRVVADVEYTPEPAVAGRLNSTIWRLDPDQARPPLVEAAADPAAAQGRGLARRHLPVRRDAHHARQPRRDLSYLRPDQLTRSAVLASIGGGGGVHRMAGRRAAKPAPPPAPPPAEKVFSWYDRGIRL